MMMASILLGLAVVATGAVTECGEVAFQPSEAEKAVPELFRLDAATFRYELELLRPAKPFDTYAVRFPSPIETLDPENNTIHADYFRPSGPGKHPAVVVLHILGADFALSRYLAARLADRGVAALFVQLPYYGARRPADGQKRFLSGDMERSMRSMRQAICDVRRAGQWLASRPEIDANQLGVTGISLGGIVAALSGAVDPQLRNVAPLLAGGGLADILWNMPEPEAARYRRAWTESGRNFMDLENLTRPYDPLTYATRLASKHVMMIAGSVDEVIPPRATRALWEAAGKPPITWYECGHYSAVGFLLPAVRRTVDFFAADVPRP